MLETKSKQASNDEMLVRLKKLQQEILALEEAEAGLRRQNEYLTALQKYSSEIFQNPADWLPWTFENTIRQKSQETADNL